jgi:hypothetical protein
VAVGEIVVVHNENKPRGYWALGRVEQTLPGGDNQIRSATVRVYTGGKQSKLLRRPVQRLYHIEIGSRVESISEVENSPVAACEEAPLQQERLKSTRRAALEARDRMVAQSLTDKA